MKIRFYLLGLIVCAGWLWLAGGAVSGQHAPEWELAWADEFEYTGLPDPKKWGYEEGYIRNEEKQFYTKGRPENARVENGCLILEARKERLPIPGGLRNDDGKKFTEYTSASLHTLGKAEFASGKIEIRAKMPRGRGMWPAFWTLGTNIEKVGWPRCGEIDILEFVGKEPDVLHGTVHFQKNGKHVGPGGPVPVPGSDTDFHRYAVEWDAQNITFFVDEKRYRSFKVDDAGTGEDNAFRQPHYLLLNFAVGGSWGGQIDDAALPQQYVVDYVRVYRAR